jgi:hypothetical protein
MAALLQDANQVTTDEATGAGHHHEIILGHWAGAFPASIYKDLLSTFGEYSPFRPRQVL